MPVSDQGELFDRYVLIPRTLVFLFNHNRVLLIKGAPDKRLWAGLYNGLGGHIEPGEDVLSAARRELQEESGISPADLRHLRLCGVITIDTNTPTGIAIYVFKGEYAGEALLASGEGQAQWVELDQLHLLALVEDLPSLLPKVVAHQPGDPPFTALYTYTPEGRLEIQFARP